MGKKGSGIGITSIRLHPSENSLPLLISFHHWLTLVIVYLKKVSKVVAGSGFSSITWHVVGFTIV